MKYRYEFFQGLNTERYYALRYPEGTDSLNTGEVLQLINLGKVVWVKFGQRPSLFATVEDCIKMLALSFYL